jgi:hypothetical protein
MTNEALAFMLDTFFSGVNYTTPVFYFGLGINWTGDEVATSTAAKMTAGSPNYPVTNPFEDAGSRTAVDWSAGAIEVSAGVVKKFAPPVANFTMLLVDSSGYQDMEYMITENGGIGPAAPPAVLWSTYGAQQPPNPAYAPGDILEVTITEEIFPQ